MSGGVFDPQGPIALSERNLIILAVVLMLLVAIPMLILLYTFAWKYRAGNHKAEYDPNHVGGVWKQLLWWVIPAIIIVAIAIINWQSTHALDPYKSIPSPSPSLTVEVVALPWKWLFIYPQQGIATVNFLEFPAQTPVHFMLTADAPMSSFWIPQLGSQIYAMAAMQTQLSLEASSTGEYEGKDTEINGAGYAGMTFTAKSVSQDDFNAWVAAVKKGTTTLSLDEYNSALFPPSSYVPSSTYASVDPSLYDTILMKYMIPPTSTASTSGQGSSPTMPADMPGMTM